MPLAVPLTLPEYTMAKEAAWLRIAVSESRRLNHASTYRRPMSKRLAEEFVGACGEIAVAKARGEFFVPSVNTFHDTPDVPGGYEVRGTDNEAGCLIVRDNDRDDRKYILAILDERGVTLLGWLSGEEAKEDRWVRNPNGYRPAWFVPQACLRPIEELIECRESQASSLPS